MIPAHDITGLILAGGNGSRMNHADKGLMPFQGMTMVEHVMQRLSPQVGRLMISANRNQEIYQAFGVPVHSDETRGFAGPLAGIQAGLMHCGTLYMATAPCDSPFLPPDLVARLANALIAEGADAAVAQTMGDGKQRMQPVFCMLKTSLLPSLTRFLQDGRRKAEAWHATLSIARVDFSDTDAFRNINTPEDLRKFEAT
jgi:molybdopterin-guanine dinucleotide biosynthesis protein A